MFELMLMRHARSDWYSHTTDVERPLNDRGVRDAIRMGHYLKQKDLVPDRMVVSAAQRTQETAKLLLNHLPLAEKDIIVDKELYLANRETLCEIVELYAVDKQCLLILAHNPGMDDLVSYLASRPVPFSVSGKLMTTCAVALFRIETLDVLKRPGMGQLQNLIRPKEIADTRLNSM